MRAIAVGLFSGSFALFFTGRMSFAIMVMVVMSGLYLAKTHAAERD